MLDINVDLVLISGVIFLVMLIALNYIVYKPLIKFMEDRDISIKNDLMNMDKNSNSIEELEIEAHDIITKAKKEASIIREKATEEANSLLDSKVLLRVQEIEKELVEFTNGLVGQREELRVAILAESPKFLNSLKTKIDQL